MVFDPEGKDGWLMTDSKIIYRYIHGGNAEVTLVNPNTLKGHTYIFKKPVNEREFPEDTIFAYIFHADHTMYLGMLAGNDFRRTSKTSFNEDTEAMRGVRYIVKMSNRQDLVDTRMMNLYHSGRCPVCGRPLKSAKALAAGMGHKCMQRYNANLMKVPWDGN